MTQAKSHIANSVEELVGETPLLRLHASLKDIPAASWLKKEKTLKADSPSKGKFSQKLNI
jgi:hypothetical protein